jgi:imidazole glycerol-phosphate synthase subunit HisH
LNRQDAKRSAKNLLASFLGVLAVYLTFMSTVILDYGIGNLRSVQRALAKAGAEVLITSDPQRVAEAERVVLPGVGAFGDCMAKFRAAGFEEAVRNHISKDKPFLGICVGMQMLFTTSYENGTHAGLGIFPGEVVRFSNTPGYKVPHMGWNQIRAKNRLPLWSDLPQPAWFYFVHSYHCVPTDPALIAFETDYIHPFCSAIQRGRLLATQFHPEKSQKPGAYLLHKFITMG